MFPQRFPFFSLCYSSPVHRKHIPDLALWVTRLVALLLLASAFAVLLAKPIELNNSDIGRHLVNGWLFVTQHVIPHTNLYSYTFPDFPFIDHHWLTGVAFYLTQQTFGWNALSYLMIFLELSAFLIFFALAWKRSSFETAFLFSLVFLPLITSRSEVRPEAFSFFLFAVFIAILQLQRDDHLPWWTLLLLPILEILWVNLHIYFFLGIAAVGAFALESVLRTPHLHWVENRRVKKLWGVLVACVVATLVNPFGWQGAIAPATMFHNFGYDLAENKPFTFIESLMSFPLGTYVRIGFAVVVCAWLIALFRTWRHQREFPLATFILALFTAVIGWMAIRNLPIFGLVAVFGCAAATTDLYHLLDDQLPKWWQRILAYPLLALVALVLYWAQPALIDARVALAGTGLAPNALGLNRFLNEQKVAGPIMNNYDIGGALIYALYPREKVFTDNRPEAYPASFFTQEYIPMQQNDDDWTKADEKYGFNAIVFHRLDLTEWGQNFLIKRVADPAWAPVYVDETSIVILKRNDKNAATIKSFEIPKSRFRVTN